MPPEEKWTAAYANCAEARAPWPRPVRTGEKGYAPWLDADGDGVGCEWG
ncbi:excalibur calcium-binding domain-containing protein [Streptomyces sp. NPDC003456]